MKMELLAPAGCEDSFFAALNNGADAIYLGLENFNARRKAKNFSLENLPKIIKTAHFFGVKIFVAFNTILKSSELEEVVSMVEGVCELGADAIIIADLKLLFAVKKRGVKIPIHASTQMGIHNKAGAIAARDLGFSRVILARETSLSDIKECSGVEGIQLEFFVHGALCVAFSGNCYYSSLLSGESGNRGRCLQLCRKKFTLEKNEGYLLSAKDINLSSELHALGQAGIASLKIEGRLRSANYVGGTTSVYRRLLDEKSVNLDELKVLFNRGDFCKAYLFEDGGKDIIYPNFSGHKGLEVGRVKRVDANNRATIEAGKHLISKGDGIKFMRGGYEVGGGTALENKEVFFKGLIKAGDTVHLTNSIKLNEKTMSAKRAAIVKGTASFEIGKKAHFSMIGEQVSVVAESEEKVSPAKSVPITYKNTEILAKMSNKILTMSGILTKLDESAFIPLSQIKKMRNYAEELFIDEVLEGYPLKRKEASGGCSFREVFPEIKFFNPLEGKLFVMVKDCFEIEKLLPKCDFLILSPQHYRADLVKKFALMAKEKAILNLPIVCRGADINTIKKCLEALGAGAVVANNLWALSILSSEFPNIRAILGRGLNLFELDGDVLHIASIESTRPASGAISYIYGNFPIMTLSNSFLLRTMPDKVSIIDEKKAVFTVRRVKIENEYFEILLNIKVDNREVLGFSDCSCLIDLTNSSAPYNILCEILCNKHSEKPHMHANYKKQLS